MELDRSRKRGEDVLYSGNENNKDHHTKRVAIKLSKKANSGLVEWKSVNKKKTFVRIKAKCHTSIKLSKKATRSLLEW